jgi:hypothetical protein
MSCVAKIAYLWKNMINIILTRSLAKWNSCGSHTTVGIVFGLLIVLDSIAGIFMVLEPELFVRIRAIKSGFIQRDKIFPTLVLDGTQQIQETF